MRDDDYRSGGGDLYHRTPSLDADASSPRPFAELLSRLRVRLAARKRRVLDVDGFDPAAVAVVLHEHDDGEPWVILTRRAPTLRAHAGQVALPGGRSDHDDDDAIATALRECHEEVGLRPASLQILGAMDDEPTTSGFVITPVLTALKNQPCYAPNPSEVAEVFEAPLSAFADRSRAEENGRYTVCGAVYTARAYRYRHHRIQGATARILEQLNDLIRQCA